MKIGEKEYTLRTPKEKEFMSLMGAERARLAEAGFHDVYLKYEEALLSGQGVDEAEAVMEKAWLLFCSSVFNEDVSELGYDNLLESEVFEIQNFFTEAWKQATPLLRKRIDDFRASKEKASGQDQSQQVTS